MNLRKLVLLGLTGLGLTPLGAYAGDEKIYPGSNCSIQYECQGSSAYCSEQKRNTLYGRLFNGSTTSTLSVDCPLIKDDYGGSDFNSAGMFVTDANPTRGIYCTFYSMNAVVASPTFGWFSSRSTSSGYSSTNPVFLGFSRLSANPLHGYAGIRCSMPALYNGQRSYINSYRVDE